MATALFVKREDLVRQTALSGSIDLDRLLQFVKVSQEIHIQNYLGTDLYNKISADILANDLEDPYLSLVNDYIQPMLIHWSMVEYIPFAAYTIANGGVFKYNPENAAAASSEELAFLVEKERKIANYYTQRLIDYLCYHMNEFPEYQSNNNEKIYPDKEVNRSGWLL